MAGLAEVLLKDCADYDHCLVFPTNSYNDFTDYGKMVMENIQALGYETYIFKVEGNKKRSYMEYFCGRDDSSEDETLESDETVVDSSEFNHYGDFGIKPETRNTSSSPKRKKKPTSEPMKGRRDQDKECLIFVLLRTPLHKLREFAERMELKMLIDPAKSKELLAEGDPEHNIRRVVLKHDPEISNLTPYDCIYARYKKNREFLYWKGDDRYRQQDDFISTDNISRYYAKNHMPIFDQHPAASFYSNAATTHSPNEVNDDDGTDNSSINENSNVYNFSSSSISTYNSPANYSRNHSNSAILRNHPFRDLLRIKISNFMLQSRPRIIKQNYVLFTMENLKIQKLLKKQKLIGCYVLHNPVKTLFQTNWAQYPFHPQPIYDIKEYFGEKLAFFYAFLDHYTLSLFIPVVIAVPLQICVFYYDNYSAPFIPIYSILLPLWACYMSENWKKKERFYALQWGMIGYNETEQFRPEFSGEERESAIDGTKQHYFSERLRSRRVTMSMLVVCSLLFLVIGTVLGVYVLRFSIIPHTGGSVAQTVASILNGIIIQVLNQLYFSFSIELTEWENHRTQTDFENTMIGKLFILQFVNSYASLFYLAFMAEYIGDCPADVGCMPALAWNVGTIIVVRFIMQHVFANTIIPTFSYERRLKDYTTRMCNDRNHFLSATIKSKQQNSHITPPPNSTIPPSTTFFGGIAASIRAAEEAKQKHISLQSEGSTVDSPISITDSEGSNSNYITSIERDFVKNRLEVQQHELQNFADVMIQYGYNSLFISALPLTSLFTFLTNIFQIRYESQLLFHCYQRPHPRSAENIGAWQSIMEILSCLSVISNGAMIIFTMKILKGYDFNIQMWAFILFQWINWVLQVVIKKYFVSHHKEAISVQLKRQKFIISKLIYQESDDTQGWEPYHGYTPEVFRPIPQW